MALGKRDRRASVSVSKRLMTMGVGALAVATLGTACSAAGGGGGGGSTTTTTIAPITVPAGTHGELLSATPNSVSLGVAAPGFRSWKLRYRSIDSRGNGNQVTATLLVPTSSWTNGTRPIVSYAPGAHGLGKQCAPSTLLEAGTDYETSNIVSVLNKGYAIVVTDYAGNAPGETSRFLVGKSAGHAVLDAFTAAFQVNGANVGSTTKALIWGYSQGGQASSWAGQEQPTYLPSLNLKGVATGGVPGSFSASARSLNGSVGAGLAAAGIIGVSNEFPDQIDLNSLATPAGLQLLSDIQTKCVFQTLTDYQNLDIKDYTQGGRTLDDLLADPVISNILDAQDLAGSKISVPVYMYHGQADEILPVEQAYATKQRYCALGTTLKFDLYPSEHITTQFQAAPIALNWMADRLNGVTAPNNCSQTTSVASTAPPGGGDFIVSLDAWKLTGAVFVGGLNQWVGLPSAARISALTNLTQGTINGSLNVPTFTAQVSLLGLPVTVGMTLISQPFTGTSSLDNQGVLHVHGTASATIYLGNVGTFGIEIPAGCSTESPVQFPINYDGPVAGLGDGTLTFNGSTTFPALTGCGLLAPALGLLFSGPGNAYTFTALAPDPVAA